MSVSGVAQVNTEASAQEFEEIFLENCDFIYRTAYSITGNCADAEDVLQNIFLKLLRREVPPDFGRNPRGYLYRAAVNQSLNTLRSRKRQSAIDDSQLSALPSPSPSENDGELLHRSLAEAVAKLKPKAVEILTLRYTHNYTDSQIAKMLGKSRTAVAVSLYRTRSRLKRLLLV